MSPNSDRRNNSIFAALRELSWKTMAEVSIKVENLWKKYRLGTLGGVDALRGIKQLVKPAIRTSHDNVCSHGQIIWALKEVSLTISKGQSIGIIGKNGAGKSTLLKILSRITAPTIGRVMCKGKVSSLLEVGTGFHPDLTGRENVFLNGSILGMKRSEIRARFDEIVEFSGIEDFIDTPVKRYSSGMYVRLAFSVAAHLQSEILLIDEVLSIGDAEFQRKCIGKIDDVAQQGKTVLFVSHNLPAVLNLCENSVLIREGAVVMFNRTRFVIDSYLERKDDSITLWKADEHTSINKAVRIRSVCFNNQDGKRSNKFRTTDNCVLNIEIEVLKKGLGYNFSFELYTIESGVVFTSTSWDTDLHSGQILVMNAGIYNAAIDIPVSLLREGDYYLKVAATIPNVEVLDVFQHNVSFRVIDDTGSIYQAGNNRRGVILPLIQWQINA